MPFIIHINTFNKTPKKWVGIVKVGKNGYNNHHQKLVNFFLTWFERYQTKISILSELTWYVCYKIRDDEEKKSNLLKSSLLLLRKAIKMTFF